MSLPELILFFLYKVIITAISVTLPLAVGLFTPVFIAGGVLGRVIGMFVCSYLTTNYQPWEYAIIGAAAFSTGVTRAISTALIVYEIAGGYIKAIYIFIWIRRLITVFDHSCVNQFLVLHNGILFCTLNITSNFYNKSTVRDNLSRVTSRNFNPLCLLCRKPFDKKYIRCYHHGEQYALLSRTSS